MKLQQNTNTVVRSGSFEESNYTIEASAKAFSILSDGLYANKLEAVVRELSTNAYDAHVDAGHPDKPFLVHLPNRFSPKFSIRDYGTGLSHEDCMNLYTTYFGSNKTNSNDAIGCLGLGSKSPFAYTDNFLVTSYLDGKMRIYNSYKNERDEPVFALVSEDDTTACNGMEILFSVEQDDIEEFEEAAQTIYKFFKVRPTLDMGDEDNEPLEIDDEAEYVIQGSNWGLIKTAGKSYYGSSSDTGVAIMGQVAYPFDYEQFDDASVQSLLRAAVHIHFAIGELDITPSREALSYNESTKRAIKETVECILLEMKEDIEESFDECETLHAARMKYYKLRDVGNTLNSVVGIFDSGDVSWQGIPLWGSDKTLGGNMLRVDLPSEMTGGEVRQIFRDDWRLAIKAEHATSIRFDHRKDMHFIYDDLKRGGIGRAKEFIRGVVGTDKYSSTNTDMAYLFTGGLTKEQVIELLSCKESDLTLTSTLPSPTKSNRSYSGGGEVRSKVALWKGHWADTEIDMSKGGYYVEINRYEVVNLDGHRGHVNVRRLVEAMIELGYEGFPAMNADSDVCYEDVEIYGIKSQELKKKKFNQDDNWINLLELAKEFYESVVPEMLEWRADYNFFNHTDNGYDE